MSGIAFTGPVALSLSVIATVAAGFFIGSWWALALPLLAVPAFALPSSYTPGAEPDYSLGVFAALILLATAIPLLALGVLAAKSR
ncbi:MAG: hypothetical protein H0U20_05855 [Thermoleophilaceae bacterium]|nr:hypothetical protein [Thermoleophilaceae bacterium]